MEKILIGKNAIITGARRGIGKAAVKIFAENGANVWACAKSGPDEAFERDMAAIASKYSVWVKPLYFNLANEEEVKAAVKAIMADKQPVDALINVAGISYNALVAMTTRQSMSETLEIDFAAPFFFTQKIIRLLAKNPNKKTSIVHISSIAAIDANSGRSAYGAAKASVICASGCMAEELGSMGIRSNCIAPGIVDTEMVNKKTISQNAIDEAMQRADIKRLARPEEIANTAAFLASDLSLYVTGQTIRVDGGTH